jgi:uncharacterized Zn-finger protein
MQVFSVLILHCLMHFRCIIEVSYLCHNGLNQHQDLGLIIFSSLNFLCTVEVNYLNHSGLDQHPDSGLSFYFILQQQQQQGILVPNKLG